MSHRGFTLVELLVVIAIISLLVAMVIPTIGAALENARVTKCAAHLRNIGQALFTYSTDYGVLPRFIDEEDSTVWDERLLPMLGNNPTIFLCPSDPHVRRDTLVDAPRSYAVNGGQRYESKDLPFGGSGGQAAYAMDALRSRSGRLFLVGERPGDSPESRGFVTQYPYCTLDQIPGTMHRGGMGANYLFADLGVEYLEVPDAVLSNDRDYWYIE